MSFIVVWVLVVYPGMHYTYAVPGIVTEAECKRLGEILQPPSWAVKDFQCHSYRAARL